VIDWQDHDIGNPMLDFSEIYLHKNKDVSTPDHSLCNPMLLTLKKGYKSGKSCNQLFLKRHFSGASKFA
jgi:hypothetical protein